MAKQSNRQRAKNYTGSYKKDLSNFNTITTISQSPVYIHNHTPHFLYACQIINGRLEKYLTEISNQAKNAARRQAADIDQQWKKIYKFFGFGSDIDHKTYAIFFKNSVEKAAQEQGMEKALQRIKLMEAIREGRTLEKVYRELSSKTKSECKTEWSEKAKAMSALNRENVFSLLNSYDKELESAAGEAVIDQEFSNFIRSLLITINPTQEELKDLFKDSSALKILFEKGSLNPDTALVDLKKGEKKHQTNLEKMFAQKFAEGSKAVRLHNTLASAIGYEFENMFAALCNNLVLQTQNGKKDITVESIRIAGDLQQGRQDARIKGDIKNILKDGKEELLYTSSLKTQYDTLYFEPNEYSDNASQITDIFKKRGAAAVAQHIINIPEIKLTASPATSYITTNKAPLINALMNYVVLNASALENSNQQDQVQRAKKLFVAIAGWLQIMLYIVGTHDLNTANGELPIEVNVFGYSYRTDVILNTLINMNAEDLISTQQSAPIRILANSYASFLQVHELPARTEILEHLDKAKRKHIQKRLENQSAGGKAIINYTGLQADQLVAEILRTATPYKYKNQKVKARILLENIQKIR